MNIKKQKGDFKFKIEYFIAFVLFVIVIVLFLSSSGLFSKSKLENTSTDYKTSTERKLEDIISKISGVGETSVMITYDGTSEQSVLTNVETITENGIKKTTETAVLVNGKPYILKEFNPKATSVVIVCEGADDLNVKLAITEVVKSTFSISSENIKIIKMK